MYAFFDSPGLVAVDMDGNVVWTRDLGPFRAQYNMASSPILCDDMVVVTCDHRGDSFIAAFESSTGELRWKTARSTSSHSATPLAITVQGEKQIVASANPFHRALSTLGKSLSRSLGKGRRLPLLLLIRAVSRHVIFR